MRERHEDTRLSAFLDDELSDDEAIEVARHLDRCARCLAELEAIRRTRSAVRGLPVLDPPDDLLDDVAIVAAEIGRPRRLLMAALIGVALGLALHLTSGGQATSGLPTMEPFADPADGGSGPMLTPADLAP